MTHSIFAVTGTRADYGIYRPVFEAIRDSKEFSLGLLVTGMHLLPEFGHTVDEIKGDGFMIVAEVPTMTTEDTASSMAEYVGKTTVEFAKILRDRAPDFLFLLGDRGEQLAGAIAASELQIPIIHLHGGEQTGSVDDPMRHAITMMASVHLTTAEEHSERVKAMRPDSKAVYTVGAPALDVALKLKPISKEKLFSDAKFDASLPTMLFVQHPDTLDEHSPEEQIAPSIEALEFFTGNILIIGSNADAGGMHFNAELQAFVKSRKKTAFRISVPHAEFLSWQRCSDVMVGNSSSGIIEAASSKLPVVNIGNRQKGRLRSGNVIDVPYDAAVIRSAIEKAQSPEFKKKIANITNAYGEGKSAEKIVKILKNL